MRQQIRYLIAFCATAIVATAAVTSQSLWIDEGMAAAKAMQPTLHDWWHALRVENNSNLQLPFQLCYLWGWEKIFGPSEWALRASNIPWFIAGIVALVSATRRPQVQFAVILTSLTNAFLWYYLSEARPYIVLFGFASLTTASAFRLGRRQHEAFWLACFCVGVIGLCVTSMVAAPWAIGAILAVVYFVRLPTAREWLKRFPVAIAVLAAALLTCGCYYIWTIRIGARAANLGKAELINLGFVFYELSGLSGLGPGRIELREHGIAALRPYLPILLAAALVYLAVCFAAARKIVSEVHTRWTGFTAFAVILPLGFVFTAAMLQETRLLGRHVTPLLPFLLLFVAYGLAELLLTRQILRRLVAIAFVATCLCSALEIRFAPRHRRDEYRTATTEARAALDQGKRVWWAADIATASYYGLPLNSARLATSFKKSTIEAPDLIFLSRPDLFDPEHEVSNYIKQHQFTLVQTLPAFQIFENKVNPQLRR